MLPYIPSMSPLQPIQLGFIAWDTSYCLKERFHAYTYPIPALNRFLRRSYPIHRWLVAIPFLLRWLVAIPEFHRCQWRCSEGTRRRLAPSRGRRTLHVISAQREFLRLKCFQMLVKHKLGRPRNRYSSYEHRFRSTKIHPVLKLPLQLANQVEDKSLPQLQPLFQMNNVLANQWVQEVFGTIY